jgi:hypothetical protein
MISMIAHLPVGRNADALDGWASRKRSRRFPNHGCEFRALKRPFTGVGSRHRRSVTAPPDGFLSDLSWMNGEPQRNRPVSGHMTYHSSRPERLGQASPILTDGNSFMVPTERGYQRAVDRLAIDHDNRWKSYDWMDALNAGGFLSSVPDPRSAPAYL